MELKNITAYGHRENTYLFTPVRNSLLFRLNGKKKIMNKLEAFGFIITEPFETLEFAGAICYCGFTVDEPFEHDNLLDIKNEVKFRVPSQIFCEGKTTGERIRFISQIQQWIDKAHLTDSRPFWCNVNGFELKPIIEVEQVVKPNESFGDWIRTFVK